MIRNLPLDVRRDLRSHLMDNGVYVPTGKNTTIPSSLYRVINEDDLDWPEVSQRQAAAAAITAWSPTSERKAPDPAPCTSQNAAQLHVHETNMEETPVTTQNNTATNNQNSSNNPRSYGFFSLMKAYTSSRDKYNGTLLDNFERKLKVFFERCDQTGVPDHEKATAFSLMLEGVALQYYVDHIKTSSDTIHGRINMIKQRFVTHERTLSLIREWESTTLIRYIETNPTKPKKEVLELMICRLQDLQLSLPDPYRPDLILKNKLLSACEGIEECRLARQKVAPTVDGVIADLYTSISTAIPTP
eukprot:IDg22803t1